MPAAPTAATTPETASALHAAALQALARVLDPESGLDIVEMGLVERLHIGPDSAHGARDGPVTLDLVMTSAACPMVDMIADDAEAELTLVCGLQRPVAVRVLDSPAWHPGRMGPQARAAMGWDGDDAAAP
jgi:metal-sulfur cluster biosynthetic enzyme